MAFTFFIDILLLAFVMSVSATTNTEIQRVIDLTSPMVKITIDVKASNIEKEYKISFPDDQAKHLAFISVTKKGKSLPVSAPVT
jgi:hypothetical protein